MLLSQRCCKQDIEGGLVSVMLHAEPEGGVGPLGKPGHGQILPAASCDCALLPRGSCRHAQAAVAAQGACGSTSNSASVCTQVASHVYNRC